MKPDLRQTLASPSLLFVTGFASGLSPKAPGTAGTVLALLLYFPLALLPWWLYGLVVISVLSGGIYLSGKVAEELSIKDPGLVVVDEFVGLWITLFLLPGGWIWPLIGFVLFRFFDILKPWPVSSFEKLPGGWGIMLDDVVAGLIALALIQTAALTLVSL